MRYVYPVVSRRAGGVSVGVNLNPNNACNWACIYCQVPGLSRGGPPPLDLPQLLRELNQLLAHIQHGDFLQQRVPVGARQLMDVAFSGNGEPTSAPEFAAAVAAVAECLAARGLGQLPLRLISNGSRMLEPDVQGGLARLAAAGGEVWFKIDAASTERMQEVNGVTQTPDAVLRRLRACAAQVRTWVQSCWFCLDGALPAEAEVAAYLDLLAAVRGEIAGVLLYGLARPSQQPGAARLSAVPAEWLEGTAQKITALGIAVRVSP